MTNTSQIVSTDRYTTITHRGRQSWVKTLPSEIGVENIWFQHTTDDLNAWGIAYRTLLTKSQQPINIDSPIISIKSYCPSNFSSKYKLSNINDLDRMFIPTSADASASEVGAGMAPPRPRCELFVNIRVIRPSVFALSNTSQTDHSSSDAKCVRESITLLIWLKRDFLIGALPSIRRF